MVWYPIPFHQAMPTSPPIAPTQSHTHNLLMHSYPQSMSRPTELLISRSNSSHFSSWIQVSLPSTGFLVRGWATACEFPRNSKSHLQKYMRMQTNFFLYWVLLYCQYSDQPFIATDAVAHLSVLCLHVHSVYKPATPSENEDGDVSIAPLKGSLSW